MNARKPADDITPDAENREELQAQESVTTSARPRASERNISFDDDDTTCCHRALFCNPYIRDINVTNVVFSCFGAEFTWANAFWLTTSVVLALMGWAILYFLLGDTMLPQGSVFGLFILIIFSYALGWALAYIPYLHLPPVFGMLLAGIIVRNTKFYDIHEELGVGTTAKIRTFCLTFIMMRAGLQLSTTALRFHVYFIALLSFIPCTVEMMVVTACSRVVLGYPWDWALMTGTIVACMSPVVTVNCMLALAERGYGEDKGLATLLCTASSIDNIHIISLFSIFYSAVFSKDMGHKKEWSTYIPGTVLDLLMGLIAGFCLGFFLIFFPHRGHKYVLWYRFAGLVLGSLMCTTAASTIKITGGGYLATLIMSFIAITGWRILTVPYNVMPFRKAASLLWHFMQPVLVGVIGADIELSDWKLLRFTYYVVCIVVGLSARCATAYLTTLRTPFSWREGIFIALAWIPKGTLQAALAPMAFERARKEQDERKIELALDVVRLSVVAIVFLAPLGAIAIMTAGPFLLNKISEEDQRRNRDVSYLQILSLQPVRKRRPPDSATASA